MATFTSVNDIIDTKGFKRRLPLGILCALAILATFVFDMRPVLGYQLAQDILPFYAISILILFATGLVCVYFTARNYFVRRSYAADIQKANENPYDLRGESYYAGNRIWYNQIEESVQSSFVAVFGPPMIAMCASAIWVIVSSLTPSEIFTHPIATAFSLLFVSFFAANIAVIFYEVLFQLDPK